jgi:hypothetical protein
MKHDWTPLKSIILSGNDLHINKGMLHILQF